MIVNDVYVDPTNPQHVLLATDRGGVLESDDGGILFRHSNSGFTQRQIRAYASDPHRQATVYLGVINGKQDGGVFKSTDAGRTYEQLSDGLNGHDVLSLAGAPDGAMVAGTEHGIFRLAGMEWVPSGRSDTSTLKGPAAAAPAPPKTAATRRKAAIARRQAATPSTKSGAGGEVNDRVFALATVGDSMYAATSSALLWSGSAGGELAADCWGSGRGVAMFVVANKIHRAGRAAEEALMLSADEGMTWKNVALPSELTQIAAMALDSTGELWVGGRVRARSTQPMGARVGIR